MLEKLLKDGEWLPIEQANGKTDFQKQREEFERLKEQLDKAGYIYGDKYEKSFVHPYEYADHIHRMSMMLKIIER